MDNAKAVEALVGKTGPEFYVLMLVILILGIVGLFLWARNKTTEKVTKKPQNAPNCTACLDSGVMAALLDEKFKVMGAHIDGHFGILEQKVEDNAVHAEARTKTIERKLDAGFSDVNSRFREVHSRIDEHYNSHAEGRFRHIG